MHRGAETDETITDVAVIPNAGMLPPQFRDQPPPRRPIQLAQDLSLEHWTDADSHMTACEVAGERFRPARQYGQHYAFVRRNAPGGNYAWDSDRRIQTAIALSRLVRSNAHGTDYAARHIVRAHDGDRTIAPVPPEDRFYAFTYREPAQRTWLDAADAHALGALIAAYDAASGQLPRRVETALWTAEYAARERYLHIRFVLVVTAVEALITIGDRGLSRQFSARVPAIANELGIADFDEAAARRVYKARSSSVHTGVLTEKSTDRDLAAVESILHGILRNAIEQRGFLARFSDAVSIRQAWPVMTAAPTST